MLNDICFMYYIICIFLINICSIFTDENKEHQDFYAKCVNHIYRQCKHRSEFSEQEIENARIYIQNRYYNTPNPAWRPVKPPCKKLRIRRDFMCLSHIERLELIDALHEMYRNGAITRLALWPHAVYWGETHKFTDFSLNHRIQMNEFEKELQKVNPRLTLPYWAGFDGYDKPELSILWDYIGRAGNKESNYCVRDGPFADVKPCVKRHWINDTSMTTWNPMEIMDANLQLGNKMSDFGIRNVNPHFKIHLAVGGLDGHMSAPNAPYDNSFQFFHLWNNDLFFFKWQLQDDNKLMTETYEEVMIYDWEIQRLRTANMTRDIIIYFNVPIIEAFQKTFGDLCSIPDVIVEDVNNVIAGRRVEMPDHYKRMPKAVLKKYFPKFYSGNYTPFDFVSHNVMNCNRKCRHIRHSQDFVDTPEGRALLTRFKYWSLLDMKESVIKWENIHKQFTDDLNSYGYCSPYIIS